MIPTQGPIHLQAPKSIRCCATASSVRNDKRPSRMALPTSTSSRRPCKPSDHRYRDASCATAPPRVVARRIRSSKSHAKRHRARVLYKKLNRTRSRDFRKRRSCAGRLKAAWSRAPACWQWHFVFRLMLSRAHRVRLHAGRPFVPPGLGVRPPSVVVPGARFRRFALPRFAAFGIRQIWSEQESPAGQKGFSWLCLDRDRFRLFEQATK